MNAPVIEATISRANGHGFQVAGRDGWLNVSKFAPAEDVAIPAAGTLVALSFDAQGFVRRIIPLAGPPVGTPVAENATQSAPAGQGVPPTREQVITRLAVLNTAVALLSSGGQTVDDLDAVLDVAVRLEAWATR